MPWCETCSKYLTPSTIRADGTCPTCRRPVAMAEGGGEMRSATAVETTTESEPTESTPWHFKLLVVGVVGYLAWRLVQLVGLVG